MAGWGWGFGTKYLPRRPRVWQPSSAPGLIGEVSLSHVFSDLAGTIPANAGQAVASLRNPWTGNQLPSVQSDATRRPILQSGGGRLWLEFDGINDCLAGLLPGFAQVREWTFLLALRQTSAATWPVFGALVDEADELLGDNNTNVPAQWNGLNTLSGTGSAVGIDLVLSGSKLPTSGGNAATTFTDGRGAPATITNGTDRPIQVLNLGGRASGRYAPARVYGGLLYGRALTAPELAPARAYLAGKMP
jgi:hypothetical protein